MSVFEWQHVWRVWLKSPGQCYPVLKSSVQAAVWWPCVSNARTVYSSLSPPLTNTCAHKHSPLLHSIRMNGHVGQSWQKKSLQITKNIVQETLVSYTQKQSTRFFTLLSCIFSLASSVALWMAMQTDIFQQLWMNPCEIVQRPSWFPGNVSKWFFCYPSTVWIRRKYLNYWMCCYEWILPTLVISFSPGATKTLKLMASIEMSRQLLDGWQ